MNPATSRDLLAWMVGRRERFHVRGRSMSPALPDGTTVLAAHRTPVEGSIVVAQLPESGQVIVKRVVRIEADGRLFLRGDGEITTDSRDYGALPADAVLGVVVSTFP
ncbi:MAG: peptidase S24 [Deltaproteobacteria bacterium]|nr:peptidase S24 [Deltaproteobacteria bacterium]